MITMLLENPAIFVMVMFLALAAAEALRFGPRSERETPQDLPLEACITLLFGAIILPGVLLLVGLLGRLHWPQAEDALATLPWWQMLLLLIICDDFTQYAWHRASHTPRLWPLHRAHHSAPHMGVRVVYRNNFFYYAMMPGVWISAALVYLGAGVVYSAYVLVKVAVIFGAHSEFRWDAWLYRQRVLRPLAWVVERTISTPATHFAHHAYSNEDGIGHYTGNFGNLLFFWDVLFGTARITRRYPPRVGLRDDDRHGPEPWQVQLLYPLLKSRRAQSALSARPTIVS